ncbi:MAG: hypothetical protein IT372_15320 [Polyangiaceae bacterium]|nr:hypothetical protein [Polyangiaceae bacterium]
MTPLADGFKPEDRIENAGSVRLTQSGLDFMEQNLGTLAQSLLGSGTGGVVTFPVPESSGSALIDYTLCPGGADPNASPPKCVAEIDIGNAQLAIDPLAPHNLRIHGPLPIRLQNLPIEIDYGIFGTDTAIATLNGNGGCPPNNQTYANIDLDVDISIEVDTDPAHSRQGYSRVRIGEVTVNQNQLEDALHLDCGDSITGSILDFLKGLIVPLLMDQLIGTPGDQLNEALCQQANPELSPACPTGTADDGNGTCMYPDGTCASIILGTDGHLDLGTALASISPGTKGGLDILFAAGGGSQRDDGSGFAWGDLNPVGGGVTLGLYGGAEPNPISKCVKLSDIPVPAGIAIPDELTANTVDNWPADVAGPHIGIAVSERYANYALNGMYNSGLLCLGITTEAVPLLNSGTLGLLAASSKELALQQEAQSIAIVVRPGAPPTVTFGNGTSIETDPLVRVKMDQAAFDFYLWSLDRYIRFMTATFDLDVPVNLVVTPEGLVPVLETIGVNNGTVTNSGLLRENPQDIADALGGLIASQVGQAVGGGISPIDLNGALSSLGLSLIIPESVEGQGSPGLRRLTKASDNYLGIFAAFGLATPGAMVISDTTANVLQKDVDPAGLQLPTMTRDNAPRFRLVMSSPLDDGTRTIEYSYKIDDGAWHPFTQKRIIDVQDDWMRLQGRHVISARSRIAGQPLSLDPTPATAEVVVDAAPPVVTIGEAKDGKVSLDVRDLVSDAARAKVRWRLDGGEWSAWTAASEARLIDVGEALDIDVEAMDEEGNVGTTEQAIIRGRAPTDGAEGCGCEVAGNPRSGGAAGWLALAGIAAAAARLQRRRKAGGASPRGAEPAARVRALTRKGAGLAAIAIMCTHAGCSCGDDPEVGPQCVAPGCMTLEPGLVGAYTSIAVSGEKIWVAGYAEANWLTGNSWGDLVVGTWSGDHVDWVAVDGVPAEPPVDPTKFNTSGFRGGQTEAGEDVGLWTSIAIGPDGEPAVAYSDRTNRGLRFAQRAGGAWRVVPVQVKASSDIGRYAKLTFLNGVPVIAYLAIEPGDGGAITSSVRLATGASATPGDGEWSFEDVVADKATPCREFLCGSGTKCIAATGLCTDTLAADECPEPCASGEACVDDAGTKSCAEIYDGTKLDTYPDAVGDYIAIAPDGKGGIGSAFYDRIHGNVVIASRAGGGWTTLVVDGAAADGTDTGDVGIGATLFIDGAGDWHLAYADGLSEGLKYAVVKGGTQVGAAEVADDGLGIEGTAFDDGQHIVGDDANIFVTAGGEVHISYQDATAGKLRHAVGTPSGQGHSWLISAIEQDSFAGAFSRLIEVQGQMMIANWWRLGGQEVRGDVAIVAP